MATTHATPGRGRITRPGAPNPRAVLDFEESTAIPFAFSRHPIYPDAHSHMNTIYADAFLDIADLFTVVGPPAKTVFIADPVTIIKDKIRDESIVPKAVDMADPTIINPLWARCSFTIGVGNRCVARHLTAATLKEALQHAIACALLHELGVTIGIQASHFRPGLSYLEWGTDIATASTGFPAVTSAPATGTPAPAPVPVGPPPPSSTDIATAVATAVTAAMAMAPAPTVCSRQP